MATAIKIGKPKLVGDDFTAALDVKTKNGEVISATVTADIAELLPWLNSCSDEAREFAFISFFAYGIDRLIPRRANSIDGWSRALKVSIPVGNVKKWTASKEKVETLLSFLTGDYWIVTFSHDTVQLPAKSLDQLYTSDFSQVNLFSGGLDSLIGAIDALEKAKKPVLFISHYDPKMPGPKKDQQDVGLHLQGKYGNLFASIPSVRVFLSYSSTRARDTTSRSRSILFLGLALVLASAKGINIVVPENGTVSVNYPLSPSRRSACSTRTTHPTFVQLVQELWQHLGILTTISNPYRFKTKGEMVEECTNAQFLMSILAYSNSCGKRGHRAHWDTSGTHCGICMPCLYRRASLNTVTDDTAYGNDVNKLKFPRKKSQDVAALLEFLNSPICMTSKKVDRWMVVVSEGFVCLS